MKTKLYLETTIPSYPVGWPSRDLLVAAHHQEIMRDWWESRRSNFELYVSELKLAGDLITEGPVPRKAANDAAHIAIATV